MKNETKDTIIAVIASSIIWFSLLLGIYMYLDKREEVDRVVKRHTVERMKYHGVTEAYEDHKGNIYFIREGKKCQL